MCSEYVSTKEGSVKPEHMEAYRAFIRSQPIIATLRSSSCIFEVKCDTGEWITRAYNSAGFSPGKSQDAWRAILTIPPENRESRYRFYKMWEDGDKLWVVPPVGAWLKDGRLVPPEYNRDEQVKGYYGTKKEIVEMNRTVSFVLDGPFTFLPVEAAII